MKAQLVVLMINVLIIGASIIWILKDLERTKMGSKKDWILGVIFIWAIAMPYYLYKTRGKKAAVIFIVAVFGIFLFISFFTPVPHYLYKLSQPMSPPK